MTVYHYIMTDGGKCVERGRMGLLLQTDKKSEKLFSFCTDCHLTFFSSIGIIKIEKGSFVGKYARKTEMEIEMAIQVTVWNEYRHERTDKDAMELYP